MDVIETEATAATRASPRARLAGPVAQAVGLWVVLVAAAVVFGVPLHGTAKVAAAPLTGELKVPTLWMVPVVLALGLVVAGRLPGWCQRVGWRRLLVGLALLALAWGIALALVRGPSGLDRGLATPFEYPAVAGQVDKIGVGPFIDTFTDPEVLATYPIHIQGHPLGAALLFVGLDRIGLGGPGGAAVALLVGSLATIPAVLMTVREVAGEAAARRAAPFLALAPAVIWTVTSADAFYTAVGALAILSVTLATRPLGGPRRVTAAARAALAVAGGIGFGLGVHLSYGFAPLAIIAVVVALARRRVAALAFAALGGALVTAVFLGIGFWWFDGLAATHARYIDGVASLRPYAYFSLLGNPASFALALGPAAFVAMRLVRHRRLWLLGGAGLAAAAVSNLSGLSKGEVERIWLPFVPWVLVLTAGLGAKAEAPEPPAGVAPRDGGAPADATVGGRSASSRWRLLPAAGSGLAAWLLLGQVVTAVLVESIVQTPW